jgi:hypothetical protein
MHDSAFIVQPPRDRATDGAGAAGNDRDAALMFLCLRHVF